MAPGRAHPLILVIDPCRRLEELFEGIGAVKGGGTPDEVFFQHLVRDVDVRILTDFLLDQGHGEDRQKVLRPYGLSGARVQRGFHGGGHVGHHVVPLPWYLRFRQHDFPGLHNASFPDYGGVN